MASKNTEERRNQMIQMLLHEGSIRVGEAAKTFDVSAETIRKDIICLEQQGIAIRSHGGAALASDMMEMSVNVKRGQHKDAKDRIAAEAVKQIHDGDTVILDSGTSTSELARYISLKKGLTIFTNSLLVMNTLIETDNQIYCFGGKLSANNYGMFGGWGNDQVRRVHADVCFLGTEGFLGQNGPSTALFEEAEYKRQLSLGADRVIILSDSSKFARTTAFCFADWSRVDALITDKEAPENEVSKLRTMTEVILV